MTRLWAHLRVLQVLCFIIDDLSTQSIDLKLRNRSGKVLGHCSLPAVGLQAYPRQPRPIWLSFTAHGKKGPDHGAVQILAMWSPLSSAAGSAGRTVGCP